jgi:hypothetical protein
VLYESWSNARNLITKPFYIGIYETVCATYSYVVFDTENEGLNVKILFPVGLFDKE